MCVRVCVCVCARVCLCVWGCVPGAQLHPLQQVWPHLHKPCRMRAWVEVPENYDRHTWDQSVARRVVLDNQ